MHKLALAGMEIAGILEELARDDLKPSQLQQVLRECSGPKLDIFVACHKNVSSRSVTRYFINYMGD
jgi:hypothetical protein